jgi:hypothetical protein
MIIVEMRKRLIWIELIADTNNDRTSIKSEAASTRRHTHESVALARLC